MNYNKNQIGRILLERLVEATGCDMQVAIRFFYNSDFYAALPDEPILGDIEEMYHVFLHEYQSGVKKT